MALISPTDSNTQPITDGHAPSSGSKKSRQASNGVLNSPGFERFLKRHQVSVMSPPTYTPEVIANLLSWKTLWESGDLWTTTVLRLFSMMGLVVTLLVMTWWERQIWSYLGQEDIEWAQSQRRHRHGAYLTKRLLALGPTFIKVGQSLSCRVDLLRKEYSDELSQLQDKVPPFDLDHARAMLEQELDDPIETFFKHFDRQPIAAASLGQVHRCQLHDGTEVVVKIQRPDLLFRFMVDLCVLKQLAQWLEKNLDIGRGREWTAIVDEFGRTLFEEIDYIKEGRHADRFRLNFKDIPTIVIPRVHWHLTTHRIITLDYEPGVKINNANMIRQMGLNQAQLATTLVRAYFQQLLQDGFFHADPHPGNLVVNPQGQLVFYDFGMVGHIPEDMRLKIVTTFLNIVNRRTDAILKNLDDLNMILPWADLNELGKVIEWALDTYYNVPHDMINLDYLADELSEVIYYYPFKLPANFTFMFRAVMTLEGVAQTLYPQIQFMGIATEYARDYLGKSFVLEQLLGEHGIQGYRNLIREGLEYIGLPTHQPLQGSPKVHLRHEEWVPLSRYVKAGFLVLSGMQSLTLMGLTSIGLIWLFTQSPWQATLNLTSQQGLLVLISVACASALMTLTTFGTILLMPSRKKPVRFNPTNMMRNDPRGSVR